MPVSYLLLNKIAKAYGYTKIRQTGSHQIWKLGNSFTTIPKHRELKPKTADSILKNFSEHTGKSLKEIKDQRNIKL